MASEANVNPRPLRTDQSATRVLDWQPGTGQENKAWSRDTDWQL